MLGKNEERGEGDDRGWDSWMASPTQWTWVWVSSGSWWWTGKPSVLQSMASQRAGDDWATELKRTTSWKSFGSPNLAFFCIHSATYICLRQLFCWNSHSYSSLTTEMLLFFLCLDNVPLHRRLGKRSSFSDVLKIYWEVSSSHNW